MKFSEIITEQYENQDPNRPADGIDNAGNHKWYDTMGRYHRDGDLPAYIDDYGTQVWFQHGQRHRDGDKPAYINADGDQLWWQQGRLHRETGPAVIRAGGACDFWLNGNPYSMEEWAEQVGMRKHEMLIMKHKLGLD
jgi:hypothetical protein